MTRDTASESSEHDTDYFSALPELLKDVCQHVDCDAAAFVPGGVHDGEPHLLTPVIFCTDGHLLKRLASLHGLPVNGRPFDARRPTWRAVRRFVAADTLELGEALGIDGELNDHHYCTLIYDTSRFIGLLLVCRADDGGRFSRAEVRRLDAWMRRNQSTLVDTELLTSSARSALPRYWVVGDRGSILLRSDPDSPTVPEDLQAAVLEQVRAFDYEGNGHIKFVARGIESTAVRMAGDAIDDAVLVKLDPIDSVKLHPDALLTPRQRTVVALIREGMTQKQVAKELGISPNTVKTHLRDAYQTLGVHRRAELLALFVEHESG